VRGEQGVSKKKRKASKSVVTPPDKLLEEAAKGLLDSDEALDRDGALYMPGGAANFPRATLYWTEVDGPSIELRSAEFVWCDDNHGGWLNYDDTGRVRTFYGAASPDYRGPLASGSRFFTAREALEKALREERDARADTQNRSIMHAARVGRLLAKIEADDCANALLEDAAQDRQGVV
jgi:hypothetical protein